MYFNPLFPYGKRPQKEGEILMTTSISIHSSHTGRDAIGEAFPISLGISIHSSHTGRDLTRRGSVRPAKHFNPLFPYGKRQELREDWPEDRHFNPLFPYGKRHGHRHVPTGHRVRISIHSSHTGRDFQAQIYKYPPKTISIHSSHTGRDSRALVTAKAKKHFNPLFPYGKRPVLFP